ncbi:MAG: asparagine synthase (glutamine-hydrolyzing) [Phycisphaerales bacterium]|nr:asparagine synthase (glutamine-hydrolyzing) [Phycisphaerales bacterium]
MCGIAGYFGPFDVPDQRVRATLRGMSRRGPDHVGFARVHIGRTNATLLHGRLAIIDPDPRANQPMTRDGVTLVFNGEIYNYRELRSRLQSIGAVFSTRSDTEALLHAYLAWGDRCVEQFEGMWAFAILDTRRQRLLLSRDRFGEKPLKLWRRDGGVYFASQVSQLAALAGEWPAPNARTLQRLMVNGYKSLHKHRDTFHVDIADLPTATVVEYAPDLTRRDRRYWTPIVHARPMTAQQAAAGVRERLIESVKLRLRSDAPIAFCLSGGVDSGAIAAVAKRELKHDIAAFSIVDRDPRYDERVNIARVASDLDAAHTPVEIRPGDGVARLERLVAAHDAPPLTLSSFAQATMMDAISAAGRRVAIGGIGSDELFGGYYDHFNQHLFETRDTPAFDTALAAWNEHLRPIVRNPHLQNPRLYFDDPAFRNHIYLNADDFRGAMCEPFLEWFVEGAYCEGLMRNRMLNELLHETVPVSLHEEDLNAMGVSVENRSPFLDSRLVEFALTIPPTLLIEDGRGKAPLRNALAGILVDDVRLDRRKVGFNVALRTLFDTNDPATRARFLDDGPIFDIVRRDLVVAALDRPEIPNSLSKFLFAFLSARVFLEQSGPQRAAEETRPLATGAAL